MRAESFVERITKFSERHRQPLFGSIAIITLAGLVSVFTIGGGTEGGLGGFFPFSEKQNDSQDSLIAGQDGPNSTDDEPGQNSQGSSGSNDTNKTPGANSNDSKDSKSDSKNPDGSPKTTAAPKTTSAPKSGPTNKQPVTWWKPTPGMTWQWQLVDLPIDTRVEADIYNVDLFDVDTSTIATLHKQGRKVICYMSAGSFEDWRPDAANFPAAVLGNNNGWPGERWLDIRAINVLMPIMEARFDLCKSKGFDAVEVDNVDGYTNGTGFPLTPDHQLTYNRRLAKAAHDRGLAIALKNDLDQIPELVNDFDLAINEECAAYNECAALKPFIDANKAVLHAEYKTELDRFCPISAALKLSSIRKNLELDFWRQTCP